VGALVASTLCFGTGYLIAAHALFPAAESAAADLIAVPRLAGRPQADAERELRALGLQVGDVVEVASASEPAGVVVAQSPLATQQLHRRGVVQLAVSSGRARVLVPDLAGLPAADAATLAEGLGFSIERREEPVVGVPAGTVVRVEPLPGTARELPASLTLFVSAPPPQLPDSVLGTPLGTPPEPQGPVRE
jgi:beta-lactam-binding protein with PASTA domain